MLGAIIGDIAGSRFEFDNYKSKDFEIFHKDCEITDDTIMTMAVAVAIMQANKCINRDFRYYALLSESAKNMMKRFGNLYPDAGYGNAFVHWLISEDSKPYNSYGNGAAMRISPCFCSCQTVIMS